VIPPERFLQHCKNFQKAMLAFDLIYPRIPERCKGENYAIKLTSKKKGETFEISLIDYLDCLTDTSRRPAPDVYSLHKYICKIVNLPACLIDNKKRFS
jgi:hypothetical protein